MVYANVKVSPFFTFLTLLSASFYLCSKTKVVKQTGSKKNSFCCLLGLRLISSFWISDLSMGHDGDSRVLSWQRLVKLGDVVYSLILVARFWAHATRMLLSFSYCGCFGFGSLEKIECLPTFRIFVPSDRTNFCARLPYFRPRHWSLCMWSKRRFFMKAWCSIASVILLFFDCGIAK